jgi:hypothetical protein
MPKLQDQSRLHPARFALSVPVKCEAADGVNAIATWSVQYSMRCGARMPKNQTRERWMELCQEAGKEEDPAKLLELIEQINRLLEEKAGLAQEG